MNTHWAVFALISSGFAIAAAAQTPTSPGAASTITPPDAAALMESCSAHKFETSVQFTGANGKPRQSRVKLCGKAGQTGAQWAATLRDAANKVRANEGMAPEARQQLVAEIEAEIEKIETAAKAAAVANAPASTFTLPGPVGNPAATASTPASAEYSSLPPLPGATGTPPVSVSVSAPVASQQLSKPRLTIRCLLPSDFGAATPCVSIESETQLTVRADEALPAGFKLRFLRRGEERGEVPLALMRQGQTLQLRPPSKLCAGVVRSSAQVQIIRAGQGAAAPAQVVETLGPFELRC